MRKIKSNYHALDGDFGVVAEADDDVPKVKSMPPSIHSHNSFTATDAATRKISLSMISTDSSRRGLPTKEKGKKESTWGARNMFFGLNFEVLIYCACFNCDIIVRGQHSRSENILGPPVQCSWLGNIVFY